MPANITQQNKLGSVQTVENNKRKAEEDVSIPDEGVQFPEDLADQCVSDMGGSPEEKTKKDR
jgi:hypothetical protein